MALSSRVAVVCEVALLGRPLPFDRSPFDRSPFDDEPGGGAPGDNKPGGDVLLQAGPSSTGRVIGTVSSITGSIGSATVVEALACTGRFAARLAPAVPLVSPLALAPLALAPLPLVR